MIAASFRVVMPLANPGGSLRGVHPVARELRWPAKHPGAAQDFAFDLRPWLQAGSNTLDSATCTITPNGRAGDLIVLSTAESAGLVTLLLGAGIAGEIYRIALHVGTPTREAVFFASLPVAR